MAYNVRIYLNTGFNSCNIPDSTTLLNKCDYVDLPSTNLMQSRYLTEISVRCTSGYEQIEGGDYCLVGDQYYSINSIQMTSCDVATLSLTYDGYVSAGGISGITILDGVVSRACVSDDTFGAWTAAEPFSPSSPLQIVEGAVIGDQNASPSFTSTIIYSTVDLTTEDTTATTYSDDDGNTVTVPQMPAYSGATVQALLVIDENESTKYAYIPAVGVYDGSNSTVLNNVARTRALGQDSGILGQYIVPTTYITAGSTDGSYASISGNFIKSSSLLPFAYSTVNNNKALCGEYNRYILLSLGSGNSAEFNPEDINDGNTSPHFIIFADPRYQKAPYCRPYSYLGDTTNVYLQALKGATWADAPLRYESKSGSELDSIQYEANKEIRNDRYSLEHGQRIASTVAQVGTNTLNSAAGVIGGLLNGELGTVVSNSISSATSNINSAINYIQQEQTANLNRQSEFKQAALSFATSQVVAPQVVMPASDTLRDFFGNGFQVLRYRLSDVDLAQYDKFLTMYGYAMNKTLEDSDFTNRSYFNFVMCSDITIGGSLPKYQRETIAAQLKAGVRIWHVLPDPTYYTSGNP